MASALGLHGNLAEREGFEPSMESPPYSLSRGAPSATRPPLLKRAWEYTLSFGGFKGVYWTEQGRIFWLIYEQM